MACGSCAERARKEAAATASDVYYNVTAGGVIRYRSKSCSEAARQAKRFPGGECKDTNGQPCEC